jgi:alkylhydroperoxidase/carboxymuconolactone decarboxylase family protein YurZ
MATRKSVADDLHDENSAAYQRGMAELHKQLGPMADAYIQRIKRLAPEFAWVNVTFPFGELYTREVVDLKTRELCTVAALTVQGSSLPQLKIHIAIDIGGRNFSMVRADRSLPVTAGSAPGD